MLFDGACAQQTDHHYLRTRVDAEACPVSNPCCQVCRFFSSREYSTQCSDNCAITSSILGVTHLIDPTEILISPVHAQLYHVKILPCDTHPMIWDQFNPLGCHCQSSPEQIMCFEMCRRCKHFWFGLVVYI